MTLAGKLYGLPSSTGRFLTGLFCLVTLCGCVRNSGWKRRQMQGNAQGTTYSIVYYDSVARALQPAVDSILRQVDASLSLWYPNSAITRFNSADHALTIADEGGYFQRVLQLTEQVHQWSEGAFDPTVYPLVRSYGFGAGAPEPSDSMAQLHDLVNWKFISWELLKDSLLLRKRAGQEVDFNAIAQGVTVDAIAAFLKGQGIDSYMVELGGEIAVGASKPDGTAWSLGVDKPVTGKRELIDTLYLTHACVATSGNYRKFYEKEGKRYSHTIDPTTGKPVEHALLSVTIITPEYQCGIADAVATAIMVMGPEKSRLWLQRFPEWEAIFITDHNGAFHRWYSKDE